MAGSRKEGGAWQRSYPVGSGRSRLAESDRDISFLVGQAVFLEDIHRKPQELHSIGSHAGYQGYLSLRNFEDDKEHSPASDVALSSSASWAGSLCPAGFQRECCLPQS